MRFSYDPTANAAYVHLTENPLTAGRDSIPLYAPEGDDPMAVTDWKDGRLAGIEILDASHYLFEDLLSHADPPLLNDRNAEVAAVELPDGIDPELWFWSEQCGGRDYLHDAHWLTHPGRMAVYCPHDPDRNGYRISKGELPDDIPAASRYWMAGFLAGNLPNIPFDDDPSTPTMQEWEQAAQIFATEGYWHVEADLDEPWRRKEAEMFEHARLLGEIGKAIESQVGPITVRVPGDLAREVVEIWSSTDYTMGAERNQLVRERAAALAYIGDEIQSRGQADSDEVVVPLELRLVGEAITATLEHWDSPR